ncbi:MAG: tyrosine-type recombinase/integrase, partial [Acidobacteriaceae bacterium]
MCGSFVDEYTDETAVRQAASGLLSDVNLRSRQARIGFITVDQLARILSNVRCVLMRACGASQPQGPIAVTFAGGSGHAGGLAPWTRSRLRGLDLARGSQAKIRNVFSVLFNHACRHELFDRNPIRFVRQSAKRRRAPELLTGAEIKVLVENLPVREPTLVLLAASTGLGQEELFGLKWRDVDFDHGELNVIRSIVCGVEGRCKTESSQKPVPMHSQLAGLLMAWRGQCKFSRDDDWVFASQAR